MAAFSLEAAKMSEQRFAVSDDIRRKPSRFGRYTFTPTSHEEAISGVNPCSPAGISRASVMTILTSKIDRERQGLLSPGTLCQPGFCFWP